MPRGSPKHVLLTSGWETLQYGLEFFPTFWCLHLTHTRKLNLLVLIVLRASHCLKWWKRECHVSVHEVFDTRGIHSVDLCASELFTLDTTRWNSVTFICTGLNFVDQIQVCSIVSNAEQVRCVRTGDRCRGLHWTLLVVLYNRQCTSRVQVT